MAEGRNRERPRSVRLGTVRVLLGILGSVGCTPSAPAAAAPSSEGPRGSRTSIWRPSANSAASPVQAPVRPPVRAPVRQNGGKAKKEAGAKSPVPFRALEVSISKSIAQTLGKAVGPEHGPALTQVVKRVLIWWLNPRRELYAGDRLALVYTLPPGREPVVHAVWLNAARLKKPRSAVLYRPKDSRFARWFEPNGWEVERRLVRSPIKAYEQITSLLHDGRNHRGVDFKAPVGTVVRAPFSGEVVRRNWSRRRNGICLQMRTRGGVDAYFLHLHRIARGLRPGRKIRRGQIIGWSGNTGRSSAPHLHYQLERNGRVLDPFSVHKTWRSRLPKRERNALKAELRRLTELRANLSRS